jgi:hypothetical protein
VPTTLRPRLEGARLENLPLMRALDRLHLADHLVTHPDRHAFLELEADCEEALVAQHCPPSFAINWRTMVCETEASLWWLPTAREKVRQLIDPADRAQLPALEAILRESIDPAETHEGLQSHTARIR